MQGSCLRSGQEDNLLIQAVARGGSRLPQVNSLCLQKHPLHVGTGYGCYPFRIREARLPRTALSDLSFR